MPILQVAQWRARQIASPDQLNGREEGKQGSDVHPHEKQGDDPVDIFPAKAGRDGRRRRGYLFRPEISDVGLLGSGHPQSVVGRLSVQRCVLPDQLHSCCYCLHLMRSCRALEQRAVP
jgi:hypothetical protein